MKYLSDEWIDAANSAVEAMPATTEAVAIGYVITDGQGGDRSYSIVLGPDTVAVVAGVDSAGVVMTMDVELATAIAKGESSAQRAFLDGRIRLGGDARVLLGNSESMTDIDTRLAKLRDLTVY